MAVVPRIGVVSDTPLQLFAIQSALRDAGYEIVIACAPDRLSASLLLQTHADAWVVSLSDAADSGAIASLLLEHLDVPVLLDEHSPQAQTGDSVLADWSPRLTAKLEQLLVTDDSAFRVEPAAANPVIANAIASSRKSQVTRHVWVLGASLGGPEAVAEFLLALPAKLPLCLVYAQHIDRNFSELLSEVMARNTDFNVSVLGADSVLSPGDFGVVPVETELRFRPLGKIEATGDDWPGPFAPAIDQVISDIAGVYGNSCGAIIFSGMGEDGAAACEQVRRQGGSIWAQSPDSCICSSMPGAAIDTGAVEYQASPGELARALGARYTSSSYSQTQDQS
jgi:chemosensory pili system protein ChpB (putative protein-glutamate methylesterase)